MEHDPRNDLLERRPAAEAPGRQPADGLNVFYGVLCVALTGMLHLSAGFSFLIWWQTRQVRQQVDQGKQALARYERIEMPMIKDVVTKLEAYGQQNRDFQPILQKYAYFFPKYKPQPAGTAPKTSVP